MLDILLPIGTTALFGFTGSLHCTAMCTSIVGSCQNNTKQYFLARSLTYTILGVLAGFIGISFFKKFLHISSPILSVVIAFICMLQIVFIFRPSFYPKIIFLTKLTQLILKYSPFSRSATFGIITALLPCGFLYAALLLSISYANPLVSGVSMLVFSLVTTPALLGGKSFFSLLSSKFYKFKKIFFAFLLLTVAGFSLMRGGVFKKENALNDEIMCHPKKF
jgi:sulfite exporter TauE/SafE